MILMAIAFMRPERLLALLVVPALLLVYVAWSLVKRSRVGADRSSLAVLFPRRAAWKRHAAVVAAVLTIASLTLAWAVPQGYINVPKDRATVLLVMDVSRSMAATDVAPTRLKAAQEGAKEFVSQLPDGFNICLISFAATAIQLVPPTTDRGAVEAAIDRFQLAPSTAIGEGIYSALDALALIPPDPDHVDDPAPAVIVLLSDGESNTGRSSRMAAQAAKDQQVPIFTIAYGTPTGYIMDHGQKTSVAVNKEELRTIANTSGGKAYSAESLNQLREVYAGISKSVGYVQEKQEITQLFVGYGVGLGAIALLGVMSLAARWP